MDSGFEKFDLGRGERATMLRGILESEQIPLTDISRDFPNKAVSQGQSMGWVVAIPQSHAGRARELIKEFDATYESSSPTPTQRKQALAIFIGILLIGGLLFFFSGRRPQDPSPETNPSQPTDRP